MGFNGMPSKACEPCREKRRRCDFKLPQCTQCVRAERVCPGYRDGFSLRLRDETSAVALKARRRQQRDRAGAPGSKLGGCTTVPHSPAREIPPPISGYTLSPSIDACEERLSFSPTLSRCEETKMPHEDDPLGIRSLSISPDDIASTYFMHAYAHASPFSYLPELYSTLPHANHLTLALSAPALVLLSENLSLPTLLPLAHTHYVKALTHTNAALSSPRLATLDSTLLSVLLLSLFEALVFRGRQSPVGWNAHVQGCAVLLRLRGERQFDKSLGWHMYVHARGHILTSCAHRSIRALPELDLLQKHAARLANFGDSASIRVGSVLDSFANLRASRKDISVAEFVWKITDLNREMGSLLDDLGKAAPVQVLDISSLPGRICAYRDCVTIYPSRMIARQWNNLRLLRLFLYEDLWSALSSRGNIGPDEPPLETPLGLEWPQIQQQATYDAEDTIFNILYGVPYSIELSERPSLSARCLIWPLSTIAVSELAPLPAKLFAKERLKFLGETYGLVQARESIHMVSEGEEIEDWIHPSFFS
ncbi:hypothetical protein GQ53DRAFT_740260 [Thozetella sp. PMI_491]|nr:hypothetical protein GQ53DRAFT_740260 [Thozetella sp. PMI_491]